MAAVKVVVTGPFAAGKTTLIRTISEIAMLSTDRDISDHTREVKQETTVAMDFGRITIDEDLVLYLFGTPGQARFDFMWEILSEGMLGFVLLVDASRSESYEQARTLLSSFSKYPVIEVPFVVAVNKHSPTDPDRAVDYARKALDLGDEVPVIPVDATSKESVKEVLLALLYAVLATFEGGVRVSKSA